MLCLAPAQVFSHLGFLSCWDGNRCRPVSPLLHVPQRSVKNSSTSANTARPPPSRVFLRSALPYLTPHSTDSAGSCAWATWSFKDDYFNYWTILVCIRGCGTGKQSQGFGLIIKTVSWTYNCSPLVALVAGITGVHTASSLNHSLMSSTHAIVLHFTLVIFSYPFFS